MENQHHPRGNGHGQPLKEVKHKAKRAVKGARKHLEQGEREARHTLDRLDQQVRENPWPVIAGVAVGFYLLGAIRK